MAEATPERRHGDASRQGSRQEGFEALHDLMRHGYVPQAGAEPQPDGILLQHASAPDLLLKPDGTIGVPAGQRVRSGSEPGVGTEKRIW